MKARRTTPLLDPTTGEPVHEPVDQTPLASEVLKELELQHGMRLQLTRLGERCRRLLLLLFYADPAPSYQEISRELGIPVGSIGPTRARCFEKLKELL
jgi:DNA-directed RNA polymerase specialized sigma24 family protein